MVTTDLPSFNAIDPRVWPVQNDSLLTSIAGWLLHSTSRSTSTEKEPRRQSHATQSGIVSAPTSEKASCQRNRGRQAVSLLIATLLLRPSFHHQHGRSWLNRGKDVSHLSRSLTITRLPEILSPDYLNHYLPTPSCSSPLFCSLHQIHTLQIILKASFCHHHHHPHRIFGSSSFSILSHCVVFQWERDILIQVSFPRSMRLLPQLLKPQGLRAITLARPMLPHSLAPPLLVSNRMLTVRDSDHEAS